MKSRKLVVLIFLISLATLCKGQVKKFYYSTGELKEEGAFDDKGKKTGAWKLFYPNGKINAEEFYKNGRRDGIIKTYGFEGTLQTVENWRAGIQEDSTWEYHSNGQVKRKGVFKDGVYEGFWLTYYENGAVQNRGNYSMGQPSGEFIFYRFNGITEFQAQYVDGIKDGPAIEYDEKGRVKAKGHYKGEEKVGEWIYYNAKGNEIKKEIFK